MDKPKPSTQRLIARYAPEFIPRYQRAYRLLKRGVSCVSKERPEVSNLERPGIRMTAAEFVAALGELGLSGGDTVLMHSSWSALSRVISDPPTRFLAALRSYLGINGTICVPSYPDYRELAKNDDVFDVRKTPSGAGLLSELVRRQSNAMRSLQRRSVSADGQNAAFIVGDHHRGPFGSGPQSPHARLADCNGKVVCLGVGAVTNTMFHCGEDILQDRFPVKIYPRQPTIFKTIDQCGRTLRIPYYVRMQHWDLVCDSARLLQYFDSESLISREIGGIPCCLFHAARFLERLLSLARAGVHMYGFRFPQKVSYS